MAALATVALSVVALLAWGAIERHAAAAPFAIEWLQLMPPSQQLVDPRLLALGVVDHTKPNPNLKASQPKAGEVVWRYHEKRVQIGGYAVPIDYDGTKITVFLLVPYAGACIHVPPPPANQIIYVLAKDGFELPGDDLAAPVKVTGTLRVLETSTTFAEVGYEIRADEVEGY
jgi:hypothetical protein